MTSHTEVKVFTKEVVWWEQVVVPNLKNQFGGNSLLSDVQTPEVHLALKNEKQAFQDVKTETSCALAQNVLYGY